jgi:hypothetical protein
MAGFNKNIPSHRADLESTPIRDNFNALAADHAGPNPPPSPESGYTWLDTSLSNQPVIKVYWDGQWYGLFVYVPGLGRFTTQGASVQWGAILGTLDNQTDLKNALAAKMPLTPQSITLVRATTNPGDQNTLWIREPGGHLHRGSVDLEMIAPPPPPGIAGITVKNEGTQLGTAASVDTLNFTGAGVTATRAGSTVTVNVPGAAVAGYHAQEAASGLKNGVNTIFSVPGGLSYQPGSLIVFLNGVAYDPASISQIGPSYTSFQIIGGDHVPEADDDLTVSFFEY